MNKKFISINLIFIDNVTTIFFKKLLYTKKLVIARAET